MDESGLIFADRLIERRPAAVLAADVVDYSRLMGEDELDTHAQVKRVLSEIVEPAVMRQAGRVVRLVGDGLLAEFERASLAMAAAIEIQGAMVKRARDVSRGRRLAFRIGIHHGELIIDGDEIYGNGVNIAARLEALADPGGIFVSGNAYAQIRDMPEVSFDYLGEHLVKNIPDPLAIYRVLFDPPEDPALDASARPASPQLRGQTVPLCPYRGLYPFREEDAPFFYGRKASIDELEAAVRERRLVGLLGPSGSGKSSVVFAGLVPRLRADGGWLIASFRPEHDPVRNLGTALAGLAPDLLDATRNPGLGAETGSRALAERVQHVLEAKPDVRRLLLIADQFEQTYTLCDDRSARDRFLDALLSLTTIGADGAGPKVTVLLTLRADFLGRALSSRALADALKGADVKLGPMTEDELREAIENPARKQGVRFELALVERMLLDLRGQPGSLPLMEFALTELWARQRDGRLTYTAYDEIGGVGEAIAAYAEKVYRGLDPVEQDQVKEVFLQLVRPGEGTEDTRRIVSRDEIRDERWLMIGRLADARLLITRRDDSTGRDIAEVVHEALIREWQRLRHWINADREFLVWRQRLADARNEWEQQGRDDGYLLREAPLALAIDWLQKRAGGIAAEDRAFIEASRERAWIDQRAAQRRRRVALIASTTAAAVFFALFIGAGLFWSEASSQKRAAQIIQSLYHADQSQQQLSAGNPDLAIRLALEALPAVLERPERPYVGEAEAQLYRAVAADRAVTELMAGDPVWRAVPSPDGERVLLASEGGRLLVFTSGGQLLKTLEGHTASVLDAEFSPDGASVVSASVDGTARLWDLADKDAQVLAGHDDVVFRARFSPDGELVATAAWDGTARLWERASGRLRHTLSGHERPLTAISFDPAGAHLATTSLDGTARVWDVATGELSLGPLEAHESPLWDVAFSPSGDRLLTAAEGRQVIGHNLGVNPSERIDTIRVWDARSGAPLLVLDGHPAGVLRARFSPAAADVPGGAAMIATASRDGTARLWDAVTGRQIAVLEGHGAPVVDLAFSHDGRRLATASEDGTARVWDTATGRQVGLPQRHQGIVAGVAFSLDGRRIVTASGDGTGRVAEAEPGHQLASLDGHQGPVGHVAFFAPAGRNADGPLLLLTTSRDHGVWESQMKGDDKARLWNAGTGEQLAVLDGHLASVYHASFSADGQRIVTASEDQTAIVWERADGWKYTPIKHLRAHSGTVLHARFSPDGRFVLTASADGTARLWAVASDEVTLLVPDRGESHGKPVTMANFSPDGSHIVTAVADGTSWLWQRDGAGYALKTQLDAAPAAVFFADFSPDGRHVLTTLSTTDDNVGLWSVADGGLVVRLSGHAAPVKHAAFSDDGRWIATASEDQTARVFEVATGREVAVLQGHRAGVPAVAFSTAGGHPRVATGSWDGVVRLFDAQGGGLLAEYWGHGLGVPRVAFSPDGNMIASASWDGTARLWSVMRMGQALIDEARARIADLRLSSAERHAFHIEQTAE